MKKCSFCKIEKSISDFNKRAANKDGLRGQCRQCDSDRDHKRYADNREMELQRSKIYYSKNANARREYARRKRIENPEIIASGIRRRRARLRNSLTEKYTLDDVLNAYGTTCYLCNTEIDLNAPRRIGTVGWENGLHLEHVIDIAKGGNDVLENVRPSHGLCNLKKPR